MEKTERSLGFGGWLVEVGLFLTNVSWYWSWNWDLKTPNKQISGPGGFTGKFYQTQREDLTPILLKLFQKIAEEGTSLNLFYEATITLISKQDKDTTKKKKKQKLQASISDEHRHKTPQQNTSKPNEIILWKDHTPWSSGIYPRDARILQLPQVNQCDTSH